MSKQIDITAMTPEMLSTLLSNAFRQKITPEQVRLVIEALRDSCDADDTASDGTVNLLQYTAFLTREISNTNGD